MTKKNYLETFKKCPGSIYFLLLLSSLFWQPVSIFPHFHEHTLPNPLLLTQHNPQWISNLFLLPF